MSVDKRPYRSPPAIVPAHLAGEYFTCAHCGSSNGLNWHEQQGAPKESIESNHGGFWVPVSFKNKCKSCAWPNLITVPDRKVNRQLHFFGDESERRFETAGKSHYYFCLALVAISPNKRSRIEASFSKLEQRLKRLSEGKLANFHAKDIMTDRFWPPDLAKSLRLKLIKDACEIVAIDEVTKFVFAGAAEWRTSADQRHIRDQVFSAAYFYVLENCTRVSIAPKFTFDRVKNNQKNGWAEECVTGIRYQPLFVWCSGHAHISSPEFITGGTMLESKIADVLAYVTAREFDRAAALKPADISSSSFGATHFAGFDGRGDLLHEARLGFPLERIFALTAR